MKLRSIAALAAISILALTACRPASAQTVSCYVGGSAGATAHVIDIGGTGGGGLDGIGGDGYSLAAIGGCDLRTGGFVLGAIGDYAWHNAETTLTIKKFTTAIKLNETYFVGGRVGYDLSSSVTPYMMAGHTWATGNLDAHGWTFGGGIDVALDKNWFMRAEYRQTLVDMDSVGPIGLDARLHEARLGLAYRFNADGVTESLK